MKKISALFAFILVFLSGYSAAGSGEAPLTWSIVASYTIPGKASGLAWDGTYIYFGIYGSNGNEVYRFNPSNGTYVLQCTGPFDDAYGLTYKSPNLVTINQPANSSQPSQALEFTLAGVQANTVTLPDHYMSGIAWDNGNYWVCTYYPDPGTVYKVTSSGTVLSQFTPPANQPWDICTQGSDLWIADYNANMLYKVSNTGTLLDSHASQGIKPSGVVYDGSYLWYCDGQLGSNSTLYKVDLLGSGTPAISVPVTSHDYGPVPVGSSSTWNCQVQNTGNANLVITGISIPTGQPITTSFSTPQTIAPGGSVNIPLTYSPVSAVTLNTQVTVVSNDPIHPAVDVSLTGTGVYTGAHIFLPDTAHDWGTRRMGAYSRWFLTIKNDGNALLTITDITSDDPQFIPEASQAYPINLNPLEQAQVGIWFHPEEGQYYAGHLSIQSNAAGQNPLLADVAGTGLDTLYPMGQDLWSYMITAGFDNSPKSILPIQDITGDGVDDVLVGSEDDYIRCFNGNASVTADVMWATEIYAGSVYDQNCIITIEDIDNDGYRDVIAGTAWGDRSIVALSGKTGQQIWKHNTDEYGDGGWVYQVDARYDYNNDGFPDVLAATGNDGNNTGPVRVYCLNGKTGVSIWENNTGGPVFSVTGVEDFTGDGQPDAVAGASNQQETSGRVYGINGANGNTAWTNYPAGTSVWALMQIDDFTGDGIKDIAIGDYAGRIAFLNAATGARVSYYDLGPVLVLRFEDMGDISGDGHPDILVSHSGSNAVVIDGSSCSPLWSVPLADKSWCVANIGDVSWDGVNDPIIGTLFQSNYVYFLDGTDGSTLESLPTGTPVDAINSIPDIVGDQTREMVVGGRNGAVVCLSGGYDPSVYAPGDILPHGDQACTVYPNPCRDVAYVRVAQEFPGDITITISDLYGKQLTSTTYPSVREGDSTLRIDLDKMGSAGMLILDIRGSSFSEVHKIIVL